MSDMTAWWGVSSGHPSTIRFIPSIENDETRHEMNSPGSDLLGVERRDLRSHRASAIDLVPVGYDAGSAYLGGH